MTTITIHKGIATFEDGTTVPVTEKQIRLLPELVEALDGMTQEKGAGYQEWQAAKAILEEASNIPTA